MSMIDVKHPRTIRNRSIPPNVKGEARAPTVVNALRHDHEVVCVPAVPLAPQRPLLGIGCLPPPELCYSDAAATLHRYRLYRHVLVLPEGLRHAPSELPRAPPAPAVGLSCALERLRISRGGGLCSMHKCRWEWKTERGGDCFHTREEARRCVASTHLRAGMRPLYSSRALRAWPSQPTASPCLPQAPVPARCKRRKNPEGST